MLDQDWDPAEWPEFAGMRITSAKATPLRAGNDYGLLAYASVTVNDIIRVSDIKVTVDRESRVRVQMPTKQLKTPLRNGDTILSIVRPLSEECREWIAGAVLRIYYRTLTRNHNQESQEEHQS